jgi:hypothetical protein
MTDLPVPILRSKDMATSGSPASFDTFVRTSKTEVYQRLMVTVSGNTGGYFDGIKVSTDGSNMIALERKYVPTWAIVVAVIGFFCFLLGLLALLARSTETCTIMLAEAPGGTNIRVSGVLPRERYAMLSAAINAMLV